MRAIAEAPGKVIISGEHFVVHGGLALAAAIDRVTRAEAVSHDGLVVETGLHGRHAPHRSIPFPVERVIAGLYRERSIEPRVRLRIASQLPAGSGLGSSASTMMAGVAAVSRLEGWDLDPKALIRAAMVGEQMIHGNPSGIDPTICALGGVIQFRMSEDPRAVDLPTHAKLLVAYSGTKRSSGKLIHKVSSMGNVYPHLFKRLCDSATLITEETTRMLCSGNLEGLGELMTYNHAVLGMVGASTPALDQLVDLCISCGCYGAKLTGAGGGGSVLAIPPKGEEAETVARLSKQGFGSFVTEIPCGGVRTWTDWGR